MVAFAILSLVCYIFFTIAIHKRFSEGGSVARTAGEILLWPLIGVWFWVVGKFGSFMLLPFAALF